MRVWLMGLAGAASAAGVADGDSGLDGGEDAEEVAGGGGEDEEVPQAVEPLSDTPRRMISCRQLQCNRSKTATFHEGLLAVTSRICIMNETAGVCR